MALISTNQLKTETINIADIDDSSRVRSDLGDINGLAESIKRFGIIQPIVLQRRSEQRPLLVAGGRRLGALRKLGTSASTLRHGHEFVWRDEDLSAPEGQLRIQAMELEENLKREDLSWSEVILGKRKLLELMQGIYGASAGFGENNKGLNKGFGVNRLAQMLGENPSTTSRDLELAGYVVKHPMLAKLPTKSDAQRKLGVAVTVAAMQNIVKKTTPMSPAGTSSVEKGAAKDGYETSTTAPSALLSQANWRLYRGRFQHSIHEVANDSCDLVLTDLPYNIGLGDSTASHGAGLGGFSDSELDMGSLCADVSRESFRILRQDRFAVFFFGMAYYELFTTALTNAGFTVDTYPFIWIRDRTAPPDGSRRYSKTYDPALICSKGDARFIRPNRPNSVAIPSVRGPERLHTSQKPVELMRMFVEDMTTEGCTVVDMFAGAGSTGEAALRAKRKAILFELEEPNCVLIKSRLGALGL